LYFKSTTRFNILLIDYFIVIKMSPSEVDFTPLMQALGLDARGTITITPNMSGLEENPLHDWLYLGMEALRKTLTEESKRVAIIGSGNGIDAIVLSHLASPDEVVVTDLLPELLPTIQLNIEKNTLPSFHERVTYRPGRDCQPLDGLFDIIYANLPIMMGSGYALHQERATTTIAEYSFYAVFHEGKNDPLARWSLLPQLGFLRSAGEKLTAGGKIITLIGGRVPYDVIDTCFKRAELQYTPVGSALMRQSDPEFIEDYAKWEYEHGIKFNFYSDRILTMGVPCPGILPEMPDNRLRLLLHPAQISAQEAHQCSLKGEDVAHIAYAFKATK
jgi:hypothetical protein